MTTFAATAAPETTTRSHTNDLAEYVRQGVEQRGFRYVFDNRLDSIWPPVSPDDRSDQMEQIRQFARDHGWAVHFTRQGRIAIFRQIKSDPKAPNGSAA